MKKLFVGLLVLSSLSAFATERELTDKEKIDSCKIIQKIALSQGRLSLKRCLYSFEFDLISETSEGLEVEAIGHTVEDMATVCTIYLGGIAQTPKSYCSLE